jgi:hypothetical protein
MLSPFVPRGVRSPNADGPGDLVRVTTDEHRTSRPLTTSRAPAVKLFRRDVAITLPGFGRSQIPLAPHLGAPEPPSYKLLNAPNPLMRASSAGAGTRSRTRGRHHPGRRRAPAARGNPADGGLPRPRIPSRCPQRQRNTRTPVPAHPATAAGRPAASWGPDDPPSLLIEGLASIRQRLGPGAGAFGLIAPSAVAVTSAGSRSGRCAGARRPPSDRRQILPPAAP